MEYTELGATGPAVSALGLGAGGASKLGVDDAGEANARRLVERALDLGINVVDTAEVYGTEAVIGEAVADVPRGDLVLSTKFSPFDDGELRSADALEESLAASLERLGVEYVDVYHLHGVAPDDYDRVVETFAPRMAHLKDEGKIGQVGITETVAGDPGHEMLARAVEDGRWDAVMVGFNLLNHSARERVLEPAAERGIGTIGMVPVRRALADPDALRETVEGLIETGELDPDAVDPADPFGFLIHEGGATDLLDAAYRFARHEPTIDTVLSGTSSPDHLAANVASVERSPLPAADLELLEERFGGVDSTLGN